MPVVININPYTIKQKVDNAINDENGMAKLTSVVRQDCNEYCKEQTGMLIISSYTHSRLSEGMIVWQTPYAARQYYEIRTAHTDVNPKASWRWCEVAKTNHLYQWQEQAQKIARLYK